MQQNSTQYELQQREDHFVQNVFKIKKEMLDGRTSTDLEDASLSIN